MMNFYDNVGDTSDLNSVYVMFGRKEAWAANEEDINFAPPYPDDSTDGQADAWSRALGFVKVPKAQLKAVIPRRDWGDTDLGDSSLQFEIGDIVVTNTISLNQHPSALSGYMVYRCVDVPDTGSCSLNDADTTFVKTDCIALGGKWSATSSTGTTANIPNGTGDAIDTDDGYTWEYLYTIPPDEVINNVTSDYIVCPFPDDVINNRKEWGLSDEISYDRNLDRTIYSVGASKLRFKAKLAGSDFVQLSAPGNTGYRQITVLINPLLYRSDTTTAAVKATATTYLPSLIEQTSGEVIYMENRQPIKRAPDQVEEFSLIFQF